MAWLLLDIVSEMMSPLWSVIGECQSGEWALMSPVMTEFGRLVRWWKVLVSRVSSSGSLWSLGGM